MSTPNDLRWELRELRRRVKVAASRKLQTNWQHGRSEGRGGGRMHTQDNKQITPLSLGCSRQKSKAGERVGEGEGRGRGAGQQSTTE